jgi:hypothetical protein
MLVAVVVDRDVGSLSAGVRARVARRPAVASERLRAEVRNELRDGAARIDTPHTAPSFAAAGQIAKSSFMFCTT